jgi:N utilization substance protein B
MQTLYEWDFRNSDQPMEIAARNIEAYEDDADPEYVRRVVQGVIAKAAEIDEKIGEVAPEWPVDQIAPIDKAVLRLAIFELLYDDDVPPKVAINEAVELGKTFGSDSTSRFVNGVLGTIYRQSSRYNPADDEPKEEKPATGE